MRLNFPELEKILRKNARAEMRRDKAIWKDYKRHRKGWLKRKLSRANVGLLIMAFVWVGLIASAREQGIRLSLTILAIYATATTLLRSVNFRTTTLKGYDRIVLLPLPIADSDFLKHQWTKLVWSWTGAFVVFLLAYSAIVLRDGLWWEQFPKITFVALLQSFCGFSISVWLLAGFQKLSVTAPAMALYLLAFALLWLPVWLPPSSTNLFWSAILLTPHGWIVHAFTALVGVSPKAERLFLAPAVIVALSCPIAFRLAQSRLVNELAEQTGDDQLALLEESREIQNELIDEQVNEEPPQTFSQELPRPISGGEILRDISWVGQGWIEQIIVKLFNDREKLIAGFMLSGRIGKWSRQWRTAALITAGGIIATVLIPLPTVLLIAPMVLAGFLGAPLFGGVWPSFRGVRVFGLLIRIYSLFPVSYGEISRVILKANVVRVFFWAPLAIAYSVALAARLTGNPLFGLTLGLEIVGLVLALQPLMITAQFSGGTNDTRQFNWQIAGFLCFGIVLLILLITSIVGLFVPESLVLKSLGLLGVFVCSLSAWAGYKRLFDRGKVDVLSRPR